MSLFEKLAEQSKDLKEDQKQKDILNKEKEIAPVIARIKELEDKKYILELIKGSLSLKSDKEKGAGRGMREYSDETAEGVRKNTEVLNKIINSEESKAAIEKMGINTPDELVEAFKDDGDATEIHEYVNSREQEEFLKMSDNKLKDKLKTLGINTDEEDFSYDQAEKAIEEKLRVIEEELIQEKLKTPEGREEAVDLISGNLKGKILGCYINRNTKNNDLRFSIDESQYPKNTIFENGKFVSFEKWSNPRLLPQNIEKIKKEYGENVAIATVKKAYQNEVEESFRRFDSTHSNYYGLKDKLETLNLKEEGRKAQVAFREFHDLQNEFRRVIKEKSEELKNKGIDFNADYASAYGGKYEDFIAIGDYVESQIARGLSDVNTFPPVFDYQALQKGIEKQQQNLKKFIEVVKDLETEENVAIFLRGGKKHEKSLSVLHSMLLDGEIRLEGCHFDMRVLPSNDRNNDQEREEMLSKTKTVDGLEVYLNEKISNLDGIKSQIITKLDMAIDEKIAEANLAEEMKAQNLNIGFNDVDREISRIKEGRTDALSLISQINTLELQLSGEKINLRGTNIEVVSVAEQLAKLDNDIEVKKVKSKVLDIEISNKKSRKPGLFGKEKWEKELEKLIVDRSNTSDEIEQMERDSNDLRRKVYIKIKVSYMLEGLFKEVRFDLTPEKAFEEIKMKLNEVINRKIPESVIELNDKRKEIRKQLER